jgi:hypothetical protein
LLRENRQRGQQDGKQQISHPACKLSCGKIRVKDE